MGIVSKPDLSRLIVQQESPFNAGPTPAALTDAHQTPQAIFYVRSHGDVPNLTANHAIIVGSRSWNRTELEKAFTTRNVAATLQCAGNRRADPQDVAKTRGDPRGVGTIGDAIWTGVSLIDVLRAVGIDEAGSFVRFVAADEVPVEEEHARFGISIAMAKARDPDVLIAWAMNGELLAPDHGAPLRQVVLGYAGVRSIKWLTHVEVADTPSSTDPSSRLQAIPRIGPIVR